ncbi:hypothetical protein HDU93_001740 [Gonapodya sp. JEL0774]|nr:hypothetical protein HDU93_001740 [Gonapodya sp. JEL0774]
MSRIESQLIEAVEGGDPARVRQLLADGVSVNARKRVTLKVDLESGETKSDAIDCESALTLAILHGHLDVVRALLAHGADPNATCEWRIADHESTPWTFAKWNTYRWLLTITFSSPLLLAIGRGGRMVASIPDPESEDSEDRFDVTMETHHKLQINLKGGDVRLENPTDARGACVDFAMRRSLDIVKLLLEHGAVVSDSIVATARKVQDTQYAECLEQYLINQRNPVPVMPHNPFINGMDSYFALLATKDQKNDQLTTRIEELSVRCALAESKVEGLAERVGDLLSENSSLKSSNQTLNTENQALLSKSATDIMKISFLERENALLRSQLSSLSPPAPRPTPLSPYNIKKIMFAIADHDVRDNDELRIAVGDEVYVNMGYSDGWASGFNTASGVSGFFPLACVSSQPSTEPTILRRVQPSLSTLRHDSRIANQTPTPSPFRAVFSPTRVSSQFDTAITNPQSYGAAGSASGADDGERFSHAKATASTQ